MFIKVFSDLNETDASVGQMNATSSQCLLEEFNLLNQFYADAPGQFVKPIAYVLGHSGSILSDCGEDCRDICALVLEPGWISLSDYLSAPGSIGNYADRISIALKLCEIVNAAHRLDWVLHDVEVRL